MPHPADAITVEELHLILLQAIPDGICFTDLHGSIRFWNDAAEVISGYSPAEAVCAPRVAEVFFVADIDGRAIPADVLLTGSPSSLPRSCFLRHKDGHYLPIILRQSPVGRLDQQYAGLLHMFSATESLQAKMPEISTAAAGQAARGAQLNEKQDSAIFVIEIDHFAQLSSQLGPEAAERIFASVERTTAQCLREGDTCKRVRDGVVLGGTKAGSSQSLRHLAERLRGLITSSRIQWWGQDVKVTASIGVATLQPNDAMVDVIARAEECVLQATEAGGNRIVFGFDADSKSSGG
jgi:diguanylate cyclase (GGDEF)-like protein/PAS domain S-box-containing protein